jgi:integrase
LKILIFFGNRSLDYFNNIPPTSTDRPTCLTKKIIAMTEADLLALDGKILTLNQKLKAAGLGLQIERRGTKLNLRGTFPPKPGSDRLRPSQQRLSLAYPATPAGLKQTDQQVKIIAAQILQNSFDWQEYLPHSGGKRLSQMELAEQIAAFEQGFRTNPDRIDNPAATKTTWTAAYAPYLRKLLTTAEQNPQLTLTESLYKAIDQIPRQARSRQLCCTALNAFAQFIKLDLPSPIKERYGTYNNSVTKVRELPTDDAIAEQWASIPNPAWQFVYAIMATYGLRNHEVFFCNYDALRQGDSRIDVLSTTKTGSHEVWPFQPEWVEQFNLRQIELPEINCDLSKTTLQRVGQRVTAQFRRYGIPFSPYDLRHAWAVRTIHFGLPDTVAAKMMGHSTSIHSRTYHQWMTRRDQEQAVAAALARHQVGKE